MVKTSVGGKVSLATAFCFAVATQVAAADSDGSFAIKGAGAASCADFNAAWDKQSPDLAQYGGWISGYLTAQNLHFQDTYDLAPWQTVRTTLGYLKSACSQLPPDTQVARAVDAVLRTLLPDRLETESAMEGVQSSERAVLVYDAIIVRIQERLAELGYFQGEAEGTYDQGTLAALSSFQESEGIDVTGLPDQATLIALFAKKR